MQCIANLRVLSIAESEPVQHCRKTVKHTGDAVHSAVVIKLGTSHTLAENPATDMQGPNPMLMQLTKLRCVMKLWQERDSTLLQLNQGAIEQTVMHHGALNADHCGSRACTTLQKAPERDVEH